MLTGQVCLDRKTSTKSPEKIFRKGERRMRLSFNEQALFGLNGDAENRGIWDKSGTVKVNIKRTLRERDKEKLKSKSKTEIQN